MKYFYYSKEKIKLDFIEKNGKVLKFSIYYVPER